MKKVFRANDGTIFESYQSCFNYEQRCMNDWIDSDPKVSVKELFEKWPDDDKDEFYGTSKDMGLYLMSKFFAPPERTL